jgi:hypothetical protein
MGSRLQAMPVTVALGPRAPSRTGNWQPELDSDPGPGRVPTGPASEHSTWLYGWPLHGTWPGAPLPGANLKRSNLNLRVRA